MEDVNLGRSGRRVHRRCLGTMNFGTIVAEGGCHQVQDPRLSAADRKALDATWPGPGGEAPEAYAW